MKEISIAPLENLNKLCQNRKTGIYKQWIYKDRCFMKMCDYMQKINYSIQDINNTLRTIKNFESKNVIYLIVLVDWIKESVNKITSSINPEVLKHFNFSKEQILNEYDAFFTAIRSFAVAHPLSTDRHAKFKLDGHYICVDIRDNWGILGFKGKNFYFTLNKNGLEEKLDKSSDFYLYCYSDKDDNMKFFRIIGCQYCDIIDAARLYITKLYELNDYLAKQKKAKYII